MPSKKATTRKKGGQPSDYSDELADEICARIADAQSMRTICKADDMPCKATVFNWLRTNKEFLDQYTRAKEESADAMQEDMLDIADDGINDWMDVNAGGDEDASWKINSEHVQRSKLRIDSRKWLMSKLQPKKYGDKIQSEIVQKSELVISDEVQDRILAGMEHAAMVKPPEAHIERE
jgi:hypothetical protein